jgi:hypothetical protein
VFQAAATNVAARSGSILTYTLSDKTRAMPPATVRLAVSILVFLSSDGMKKPPVLVRHERAREWSLLGQAAAAIFPDSSGRSASNMWSPSNIFRAKFPSKSFPKSGSPSS